MKRDSMVFYRSWLDALNTIKSDSDRLQFYEALVQYGLNGETIETTNDAINLFMINARAQLDANNRNYQNGKKPKNKRRLSGASNNDNVNDNANVNGNVNDNANDNGNEKKKSSGMAPLEGGQPSDDEYWKDADEYL